MVAQIKRLYLFLLAFIVRKPVPEPAPKQPKPKRDEYEWSKDSYGEFYFREAILDQLDFYMACLNRMRKVDHSAYQLYRQTGANVFPNKTLIPFAHRDPEPLEPWFRQTLPAFGAVFWGGWQTKREREQSEKIYPRFVYFQKYDRRKAPPHIQRVPSGAVYEMTAYWDNPDDINKVGLGFRFPILVREDGTLALLRTRNCNRITIKHRQGAYRSSSFTRQEWQLGDRFSREWAAEHKDVRDVDEFMTELFAIVANNFERANTSMIRVSAERGSIAATFGVNIKRTPYFFKDREVLVNHNGNRKRIFHIVRPHIRKSGAAVHMHFRGMREFKWNDYNILITVPGLHHASIPEFNYASAHLAPGEPMPAGVMSEPTFARKVRNYIRTGRMEL
jgi:hypothetical protein